jgi:mono/diheme cytochrome c family protein
LDFAAGFHRECAMCFSKNGAKGRNPDRSGDCIVTSHRIVVIVFALIAILALTQTNAAAQNREPSKRSDVTPSGNATQSSSSEGGNGEDGKKLFVKYGCYECHGFQGQGSPGTGARIAPNPIPLSALTSYVRKPTGEMPPYSVKVLSDKDLADIYAFLKSVPSPPDVKNLPLLK